MRLLRPLPLFAELPEPLEEHVVVCFNALPRMQEESEGGHLYERQALNCLEAPDEESLRAEVLLDRPEEILYLPAFLVPEEDLPCVMEGMRIDIGENGNRSIEAIGVEEHEEEGETGAARESYFMEGDDGREMLPQFLVVPFLLRSRPLPEQTAELLYGDSLLMLSVTDRTELAAAFPCIDPREEAAL